MSDGGAGTRGGWFAAVAPYVQIARVDHWFKNVFMVLGVVVAVFYEPALLSASRLPVLLLAVLCACLVASSNYVLNEVLDGPTDRNHPFKRTRPVAAGRVHLGIAYAEWLVLAAAGIGLGFTINVPFVLAAAALWAMGTLYNVPPVRTKEIAWVDVITESVNNPIRLLMGWFALIDDRLPPLSLLIAYWCLGAFFMSTKRFAELRTLRDRERAAAYRRSFAHYTEESLLVGMFFYATACAFFGGVFIVRCKVELILFVPCAAGLIAFYLWLGLQPDSPTQNPERLHRARGFFWYVVASFVVFVLLMFTSIPVLYDVFGFDAPKTPPLWVW